MEKDNQYIIELEKANMLLEQDVETFKRQVEALQNQENQEALEDYCEQEGISHDDVINSEIEQEHKEGHLRKKRRNEYG